MLCCLIFVFHSGIESNLTGQKITIPAQNSCPDQSFFGDEILPLGVKGSSIPTKDVFGGKK
jgi:hypothetical protein